MGKRAKLTQLGNVLTGADIPGTGANKNRAASGAKARADAVGNAMFDAAAPVLMQPEVLASLPKDLASRIQLGDPSAVLEGIMYVGRSGKIPNSIPADRQLAKNNFPGGEAGFQMGGYGGRVPTDSAGEIALTGSRSLVRNPGAEAGFQLGGDVPPQTFDPTGISVPGRGIIPSGSVPSVRARPRSSSPLPWIAAGGAGAGLVGKSLYDASKRADTGAVDVVVEPESDAEDAPASQELPDTDLRATAREILSRMQKPAATQKRLPPRPDSELWATQGERSMKYELAPNSPQGRTLEVLLDAGIEPERAEGIARGIVAMTQMERDAVIDNGSARRQRTQDGIDRRRQSRMGAY